MAKSGSVFDLKGHFGRPEEMMAGSQYKARAGNGNPQG